MQPIKQDFKKRALLGIKRKEAKETPAAKPKKVTTKKKK